MLAELRAAPRVLLMPPALDREPEEGLAIYQELARAVHPFPIPAITRLVARGEEPDHPGYDPATGLVYDSLWRAAMYERLALNADEYLHDADKVTLYLRTAQADLARYDVDTGGPDPAMLRAMKLWASKRTRRARPAGHGKESEAG